VHAAQVEQIFRDYVFPKLGDKPVADIVASDIKATVAKLWNDKPEVARKTVGKIGAVLKMAIAEEWRTSGNVATMEIMSAGTLGEQVHQVRHHPALSYKAVGESVTKLEIRGDDVSCLALRWLITTGTRSSEARCPTWDEIDRGARTWSIPGHRTKNGGPHFVPLSDGALDILDRVKRRDGCPFVFVAQGREPVTETALRKLLRAYGLDKSAASLHGFRSSFRDWAAVRGVDDGVAEAALAHYTKATLGTLAGSGASIATMRAYKRTTYFEQRVEVMKQWDHFLRFG
jgi:integrase